MCKSELNACFTRVLDPQSSKSPLSHGCYEPGLVGNGGSACRSEATQDALRALRPAALECCHEDMCNYRGPQDLTYGRGESTGKSTLLTSDGTRDGEGVAFLNDTNGLRLYRPAQVSD